MNIQGKIFSGFREATQDLIFLLTLLSGSFNNMDLLSRQANHLDRSPPANNQRHAVLPAETARIHIWAKTYVIPGHIGDSLLGSDVKNLHTLKNTRALSILYSGEGKERRTY